VSLKEDLEFSEELQQASPAKMTSELMTNDNFPKVMINNNQRKPQIQENILFLYFLIFYTLFCAQLITVR